MILEGLRASKVASHLSTHFLGDLSAYRPELAVEKHVGSHGQGTVFVRARVCGSRSRLYAHTSLICFVIARRRTARGFRFTKYGTRNRWAVGRGWRGRMC